MGTSIGAVLRAPDRVEVAREVILKRTRYCRVCGGKLAASGSTLVGGICRVCARFCPSCGRKVAPRKIGHFGFCFECCDPTLKAIKTGLKADTEGHATTYSPDLKDIPMTRATCSAPGCTEPVTQALDGRPYCDTCYDAAMEVDDDD